MKFTDMWSEYNFVYFSENDLLAWWRWMRDSPQTRCVRRTTPIYMWRERATKGWSLSLLAATVRSFAIAAEFTSQSTGIGVFMSQQRMSEPCQLRDPQLVFDNPPVVAFRTSTCTRWQAGSQSDSPCERKPSTTRTSSTGSVTGCTAAIAWPPYPRGPWATGKRTEQVQLCFGRCFYLFIILNGDYVGISNFVCIECRALNATFIWIPNKQPHGICFSVRRAAFRRTSVSSTKDEANYGVTAVCFVVLCFLQSKARRSGSDSGSHRVICVIAADGQAGEFGCCKIGRR